MHLKTKSNRQSTKTLMSDDSWKNNVKFFNKNTRKESNHRNMQNIYLFRYC